ncbi:hypothetical protein ABHI18_011967 [Aspergillus niger]
MGFAELVQSIPDSYIVVLKPDINDRDITSHIDSVKSQPGQGSVATLQKPAGLETFSFQTIWDAHTTAQEQAPYTLKGYMGTFSTDVLQTIRNSAEVDYVEPNQYFHIQHNVEQPNPPSWGLSRISHRGPHNSGNNKYTYDENESGQGVTAYVVDTGIKIDHNDFNTVGRARAEWGITIPSGSSSTDNQGHGTHVAGTIAGTKYGVAKEATVVAVKVFPDNSGSTDTSTIIKGIEWAVKDAQTKRDIKKTVMNLSLGGGISRALDSAVDAAVQAGMVVAVAAGNKGLDASYSSPARSPHALTTGAIDQTDTMPQWSNWGQILDFNAPGVNIVSCGISSTDAEATLSGTSMASPHIAGLASCLRQDPKYSNFHDLAYELRLRAEGGCKPHTGHEAGTPNLAAVNKTAY